MSNNETLDIAVGIKVVRRNIFLFSLSVLLCAGAAVALAYALPKQFKSKAILNIQSSYFQNPMVNDLITEVNDPQELQAQRTSLLRLALDNAFLDSLAEQFNVYSPQASQDERAHTIERDLLLQRIQYYSLSPTTFEIAVTAQNPSSAQQMASRVLDRMRATLINERYENLSRTRTAIENHVKNLGDNILKIATPTGEIAVQAELEKVEATLSGLLMKFTESHPEVQRLRSKQRMLAAQQPRVDKEQAPSNPSDQVIAKGGQLAKQPSQEVYSDLLKKLNYLAIVLDMEKDRDNVSYLGIIEQPTLPVYATFPNKRLFLVLGLVVGVLFGTLFTIIAELGRRATLSPTQAADVLDVPLLGELPILNFSLPQPAPMKQLPLTRLRSSSKTDLLSPQQT